VHWIQNFQIDFGSGRIRIQTGSIDFGTGWIRIRPDSLKLVFSVLLQFTCWWFASFVYANFWDAD